MGPFALSVPGYRLGVHSHKRRQHDSTQRDEVARSPSAHSDSDAETQFSSTSRLPSETINPLSHSPDTLHQLAVTGLSPEDELPSRIHGGFPHKPLPTRHPRRRSSQESPPFGSEGGATSGTETDTTVTSQRTGKLYDIDVARHSARIRHLSTMAAIMHRCLRDGDMARAKRAFGLLVRTRDVDVRIGNLWTIGSEILMRDGEKEVMTSGLEGSPLPSSSSRGKAQADADALSFVDTDSDSDMAETGDEGVEVVVQEEEGDIIKGNPQSPQRWGNAANFSQVKVYLETLTQHHPHDPKRPGFTSAVDFWPALFSIELYNLDAEFQDALHQIYVEYGSPSSSSSSSPSSSSSSRSSSPGPEESVDRMDLDLDDDGHEYDMDPDRGTASRKPRRRNGQRGKEEDEASITRHAALDALRATTRRSAVEIAARIDGLLENAPYTTHAELLRLRAHAALFIGDLHLPSRLARHHRRSGVGEGGGVSVREAGRRLRERAKTAEERAALARRGAEQERARAFFGRVVEAKGSLGEEWVVRFVDGEDEEDDDDDDVEGPRRRWL